jgi:SAM-dependent methyltransferase
MNKKRLRWDATSRDYLTHRPGYPDSYFVLLRHLGVGLPGQDILDLGAGTGALSVPFARQGARVTAVDLSEGQIQAAREAAGKLGVRIAFQVAPAEETGLPDHAFDVLSASMCWGYFDVKRMVIEAPRLLRPGGRLLISSLLWSSDSGDIGVQTKALVASHNPEAHWRDRGADVEIIPAWAGERFRLKTFHDFNVELPFTRESWRGRIRASKWIGAALPPERTEVFDREHAALLERIAPPVFNISHRITFQILEPRGG